MSITQTDWSSKRFRKIYQFSTKSITNVLSMKIAIEFNPTLLSLSTSKLTKTSWKTNTRKSMTHNVLKKYYQKSFKNYISNWWLMLFLSLMILIEMIQKSLRTLVNFFSVYVLSKDWEWVQQCLDKRISYISTIWGNNQP